MILQVVADAGQVFENVNPQRLENGSLTNAREFQDLRRVDCAGGQDDFPGRVGGLSWRRSIRGKLQRSIPLASFSSASNELENRT